MSAKHFTDEEAEALAAACKRGDSNAAASMLGKSMFGGSEFKEIVVDLGYKCTGPKAIKCLAAELPPDLDVLSLDVRGCNMLAEGATALAAGIPQNLTKLTLSVQANKIGDKGAIAIYKALPKTLEILCLNHYGAVVGTEAAKVLAKNMPPKLKDLELDICDGAVGDDGMIAISHSLPKTIERLWVHIKNNQLTCRGHYIFDRQMGCDTNPYNDLAKEQPYFLPLLKPEKFRKYAEEWPQITMWDQDPVALEMVKNHNWETVYQVPANA